ncbi:hypothetical protein NIES970_29990 (plasmid) [[Synechococcus] sp. NIES-970]|nr:hypothetical protein NIES970_29990 [[Synechococcus] sp. NIES-970]
MCHSFVDGGYDAPGWKWVKPTKDGVWAIYVPAQDDWSPEQKDHWRAEQQRKEQARLTKEAELHRNGLSVTARDKNIRAIAAHLGLTQKHREQLRGRGLSDEAIDAGLFFSVAPGLELPRSVSEKLAGVSSDGGRKVLRVGVTGYACPVFNGKGEAIGFQVRDEKPGAENKYRWAKSAFSSHLQNGELPLSLTGKGDSLFLTEGTGKPYFASHRLDIRCLGASGGLFLSSKGQFKAAIANEKNIIIAPDAGDILNPDVYRRWCKILKWLRKFEASVQVAWWGQVTKDCPDIDEISSLDDVQYLTPKDWYKVAFKAQQVAKDKAELEAIAQEWKTFTPDVLLREQYLSGAALMDLYRKHRPATMHIKSGLGTSKTGSILEFLVQLYLASDIEVIFMSDINRLLIQTVKRANETEGDKPGTYHLHQDEFYEYLDSGQWIAACFQSLPRWLEHQFDGKVIILDEICSVVRSAIDGDTLKGEGKQAQVLALFQAMLKRAALVVNLDGNLNDPTANFIDSLRGQQSLKIQNIQPNPHHHKFTLLDDEAIAFEVALMKLKAGLRVVVTSDNAAKLRTFYQQVIRDGVLGMEQIVIIDQDSTPEECPPDALEKPSQFWQQHPEKRLLIYSPAANRGFDLDGEALRNGVSLFDVEVGIFEGIISVDQVDQQLFRPRDPKLDRYLYVTEKGKPNPRPHSWQKKLDTLRDTLELTPAPAEIKTALIEGWEKSPWVAYENKLRAIANDAQQNFKQRVIEHLESKGCSVAPMLPPSDELLDNADNGAATRKTIRAELRAELEEIKVAAAHRLAIAPSDLNQLTKLQQDDPETYGDIKATDVARKIKLEKTLPGFQHSPQCTGENLYLLEENPEALQGLTLFAMLNYETLAIAQVEKRLFELARLYRKTGFAWLGDVKTDALLIKTLNSLGTPELMAKLEGQKFTKEDIQDWHDRASQQPHKRRLRGIVSKDAIKSLRAALKRLGFDVVTHGKGEGRKYAIAPMLPVELHREILIALEEKFTRQQVGSVDWEAVKIDPEKQAKNGGVSRSLSFIENRDVLTALESLPDKDYSDLEASKLFEPKITQNDPLLTPQNSPPKLVATESTIAPIEGQKGTLKDNPTAPDPNLIESTKAAIKALTRGSKAELRKLVYSNGIKAIATIAQWLDDAGGSGWVSSLNLWYRRGMA